jgi:GNAT superfamily N-acetyltransferase
MATRRPQHSGVPPGYPSEYQRRVVLNDGRSVLIRPILPSDASELGEAIRSADADTIHRRFLGGPPPVTPGLLAHLTNVDYVRRFALVAIDPAASRGVGIARYEMTKAEGAADVAIAVSPAWRQAGLATVLLSTLAQAAAERGVRTFTGTYLAQNRPVEALIDSASGAAEVTDYGIAEFSVAIGDPHDAGSEDG